MDSLKNLCKLIRVSGFVKSNICWSDTAVIQLIFAGEQTNLPLFWTKWAGVVSSLSTRAGDSCVLCFDVTWSTVTSVQVYFRQRWQGTKTWQRRLLLWWLFTRTSLSQEEMCVFGQRTLEVSIHCLCLQKSSGLVLECSFSMYYLTYKRPLTFWRHPMTFVVWHISEYLSSRNFWQKSCLINVTVCSIGFDGVVSHQAVI